MAKTTFCPLDYIFIILYSKETSLCSRILAGPCCKMKTGLSVIFYWLASCSNTVCQWDAVTSGMCEGWWKGNSRGDCTRAGREIDITEKLKSHFWKVHAKIRIKISKFRFIFWMENRISDVLVSPSKWKFEYLYFDNTNNTTTNTNNNSKRPEFISETESVLFWFCFFLEGKF